MLRDGSRYDDALKVLRVSKRAGRLPVMPVAVKLKAVEGEVYTKEVRNLEQRNVTRSDADGKTDGEGRRGNTASRAAKERCTCGLAKAMVRRLSS